MRDPLRDLAPGVAPKVNLAGDCALIVIAALVATENPDHSVRWGPGAAIGAFGVAVWVIAARALHQYHTHKEEELLGDLVMTALMIAGLTAVMALPGAIAPDALAVVTMSHVALVLGPAMLWLRALIPGVRAAADDPIDVVILGAGPLARHTGLGIERDEPHRAVMGYLAFPGERPDARLRDRLLGTTDDLERILSERALDEVYVAGHAAREGAAMQEAITTCERFGTPFALPASEFRLQRARPRNPKAIADGYVHFVAVERKPAQAALKRVFDILVSTAVLVLLAPLLVLVAAAIKVESRGPVLFKQERVGLHGRVFHMLKFRSMVDGAERLREALEGQNEASGPVFKIARDPRITRVGKWIRKLSVDELPQFFNVLRGEMAIVGPRPPIPSEVAKYEGWQRRRLSIRPGITCVWQVSGRSEISFERWMYLDMQYIDHWSLLTDIKLILKTFPAVLHGRGAS